MTNKLKPCPFCGGEAYVGGSGHWLVCKGCGAETNYFEHEDEAVNAWNTRKPMDRIVEQLEEVSFVETVEEYAEINLLLLEDAIEIVKECDSDDN